MKFFIRSDKFIGFFQTPGKIQVGDTIYADSQKYSDSAMTQSLGPSYAHYSVVESDPLPSAGQFRVKAISNRVLDFLEDGLVTASGISDQIFTLSPVTHQIVDSKVISNKITITGGSGKYIDTCGQYEVKTLGNGVHIGELDQLCREKRFAYIDILAYVGIWLFLFLVYWFIGRKSKKSRN